MPESTTPPRPLPPRRPGIWGLASATFHEPGAEHLLELVHQRDDEARRHLDTLALAVYGPDGRCAGERTVDVRQETLDLGRTVEEIGGPLPRAMVVLDARYDEAIFPYRPHHYAYLRRPGGAGPPLYYAVSAALGGVPDRIEAHRTNHFETYVFLRRPLPERHAVLLGNLSRFAPATAQLLAHYAGGARATHEVTLPPKAHAEVALAAGHEGGRLERVEVKAPFRLASYVVGRRAAAGELALFDHLFTYFT